MPTIPTYPLDFRNAIDWLILSPTPDKSIEGGYYKGNLKSDPNPTNHGITQKTYNRVYKILELPLIDVKDLDIPTATEIYYHEYWAIARCYILSFPMSLIVFDTAVNCGVGRSLKILAQSSDPLTYINNRQDYYDQIIIDHPEYKPNDIPWKNRLAKLRIRCNL